MDWERETQALAISLVYAVVGIAMLLVAYKLFDRFTPTKMDEAIFERGNVAVAIAVGAYMIGVAIVVSGALR